MPFNPEHREQTNLDKWLATEFRAQYDRRYRILNRLGLLDILPESGGEMGIIGIDGQEYPIPSKEKLEQEMRRNRKVYETKLAQGFTEIQLTPFAIPLDVLIKTLEKRLREHHQQGKLFGTKNKPDDPDELLNLNVNQPVSVWNEWRGSDRDGSCVYHPTSFDETNHGGHTKAQILKAQKGLPLAGWNVLLTEPNKNIPREGKGKTVSGRKQLEANKKPMEYLRLLQTEPQYQNEQGMTNEDWLTEFILYLEETNQVMDDYSGKGSACYLLGSFKPSSCDLGLGCWFRGNAFVVLHRNDLMLRNSSHGVRSAVGFGQKLVFET